jgi:CRP-like cAMP-binding protein
MAQTVEDANKEVVEILKKVPYFKDLDDDYLHKIVNNLKITRYNEGDVFIKKGDTVGKFAIIKEGRIKFTDIGAGGSEYKELEFGPGEFFGEMSIVEGYSAIGTGTAMTSVTALTITNDIFAKAIGSDFQKLVKHTFNKKALVSVQISVLDCVGVVHQLNFLLLSMFQRLTQRLSGSDSVWKTKGTSRK